MQMRVLLGSVLLGCMTVPAHAQVFINEVLVNPPGSLDDTTEFIELLGTPNMKLDGFALAHLAGVNEKLYPIGSIPPPPTPDPEVDEFFSLDGLSLGANGILVVAIGDVMGYDLLLPDSNFARWDTIFNGGLDTNGKLENDGASTFLLIRNRPGITQADPANPAGLRWGKDIKHDIDYIVPVLDPMDQTLKAQYGDGKLDDGGLTALLLPKLDLIGVTTPTLDDDLEVVDEVSYEQDRGLEYDVDTRVVDVGSPVSGLPERKVHALDDPQGFNPDSLTRVDYRTKGDGWLPVGGASGALPNGNNWQDTATEQWVRGEIELGTTGLGMIPLFYSNAVNTNVDSIQPFVTNVPIWLNDGSGADFDFSQLSYQVMAGRLNPLAVPFIPGDADRDGAVDQEDIDKIRARFGDDDYIFANGSDQMAEGAGGDPTTQTRPWDVNTTGTNGIEPSDLQWALNFQGDTTGQIVGVTYENPTPALTGVQLNDALSVSVTLTASTNVLCGRPLSGLFVNDLVEVTVSAQVLGGALTTPGAENGVMQFVNDLLLDTAGVMEVVSVEPLGVFAATRSSLVAPLGAGFDTGVANINGYTSDFTQGLSGAAPLYQVTLRAIGAGSVGVFIDRASATNFANGAQRGVTVGHSDNNGTPGVAVYPNAFGISVLNMAGPNIAPYGAGCVGTGGFVPKLSAVGCGAPGGSLSLEFSQGFPGTSPILFLGLGNASVNVTGSCAIQILPLVPTQIALIPLFGAAPGEGFLTLPSLGIPASTPTGISVYLQAFFADPGGAAGISATNPLEIFFGS